MALYILVVFIPKFITVLQLLYQLLFFKKRTRLMSKHQNSNSTYLTDLWEGYLSEPQLFHD